jgi:hypothetical protein
MATQVKELVFLHLVKQIAVIQMLKPHVVKQLTSLVV